VFTVTGHFGWISENFRKRNRELRENMERKNEFLGKESQLRLLLGLNRTAACMKKPSRRRRRDGSWITNRSRQVQAQNRKLDARCFVTWLRAEMCAPQRIWMMDDGLQ
jgi:hypothetical protein